MGMKKILVVDYDQSTLASLQQILTGEGYEVILAGDGQVAWDKYNQEDPDLVLMEAMLSKIHGFELCQRITSVHERRVPVFIMTGVYKDRVYRTEALRSYGASEYFEKPLKIAEILASIEAVIGKSEPVPETEPEPDPDLAPGYAEASASAAALQQAAPPTAPRKPEKPKPPAEEVRWALDLEQLEKDIPKIMSDAPARSEKKKDAKPRAGADDVDLVAAALRSLPKVELEPPHGHKNNGHDGAEIDNMLKSALADMDLGGEKKKVPGKPKVAPPPVPPAEKPRVAAPTTTTPPVERPKPAPQREAYRPPQPPARPLEKPRVAAPTPATPPVERPKPASPVPPRPAPAAVPAPEPPPVAKPRLEERKETEGRSPSWEGPAPAEAPDELRRSVIEDAKLRQRIPTGLFDEVEEKKSRAGFPALAAGGVAIVILAVAGFFLFKPKPQPPAPANVPAVAAAALPETTEEQAPETIPDPPREEKPEQKPQPKPAAPAPKKAAGNGVGSEGSAATEGPEGLEADLIAPIQTAANPGLALQLPVENKPEEKRPEPPPVKQEQTAPPDPGAAQAASEAPPDPAPAVKEGDLVDLIEVDKPPSVVKRAEPVYPQGALRLGVEGVITVNALIDETGKVVDTGILRGMKDDRGLEKAAETAVRKWKFNPARKNGVNVKVWMPVVIVFKLGDEAGESME